ncbi:MAG: hypothetical protein IT436_13620 [Phycisphaerales bacterium]|nr:hypothetical protein [Phycisphaerales bacterium]
MPIADFYPAVAGRLFFCTDRMSPPDELVTAEQPVPGHPQLWVVRGARGHRFVCRLGCLSDVPPERWYRALRESAV